MISNPQQFLPRRGFARHGFARCGVARRGFSLTELLVVIGIIVLMLALAVPAFNLISGNKSVEGATNQLSAILGRARAEAIGLQTTTGVFFYVDPATTKRAAVLVHQVDAPVPLPAGAPATMVWLDLTDTPDGITIPGGIDLQVVVDGGNAPNDRYVGYQTIGGSQYGGVILFDGSGRMLNQEYGLRCKLNNGNQSPLGSVLGLLVNGFPPPATAGNYINSGLGFVMFDRENFVNGTNGTDGDSRVSGGPAAAAEAAEETWIDKNATPVIVNRYNGTLIKSQ